MSTLLARLVDDAAIFPPGNAPLDVAIPAHAAHLGSAYGALVGPLLVRDTDVPRLLWLVSDPVEVGVVVTSGADGLASAVAALAGSPVTLVTVELPLNDADPDVLAVVPDDVTVAVELPRVGEAVPADWVATADRLAASGCRLKLRTGGADQGAHPGERELAAALAALVPRPFKLTAGLHRAVRHTQDGTEFEQHGFINVMVAVHGLLDGATAADVTEVLASRDGAALAAEVRSWSDDAAAAVRRTFVGFGSCSVDEPRADLVELGLVA